MIRQVLFLTSFILGTQFVYIEAWWLKHWERITKTCSARGSWTPHDHSDRPGPGNDPCFAALCLPGENDQEAERVQWYCAVSYHHSTSFSLDLCVFHSAMIVHAANWPWKVVWLAICLHFVPRGYRSCDLGPFLRRLFAICSLCVSFNPDASHLLVIWFGSSFSRYTLWAQIGVTASWCILATILSPVKYLPYGTVESSVQVGCCSIPCPSIRFQSKWCEMV